MPRTKRRKPGSFQNQKKFKVNPEENVQGALFSFDKNKATSARKELNVVFDEYQDKFSRGNETPSAPDTSDISAAIASELSDIKDKNHHIRLEAKNLGANCLCFAKITDPTGNLSSVEFFRDIFKDIKKTQTLKSRYIHKLIPIEKTCIATVGAINEKLEPMLQKHLGKEGPTKSYAVQFKKRNNSGISREDIFTLVRASIGECHTVALNNPDITIVVQVVGTWCGLSFIENVIDFGKDFSMRSLIEKPAESSHEDSSYKKKETPVEDDSVEKVNVEDSTPNTSNSTLEDTKQEDTKQEDTKQEDTKQEDTKQEDTKQEDKETH